MYGETSGQLRDALGVLLREHRIQHRLGGKGIHTLPETTTVAEREELGKQIRRYRQCVLTWSLQAVRAANPRINLEGTTGRSRGPAEELRYRLTEALAASTATLANGDELVDEQAFATVESWRLVGRAAALGEHDFAAGVGYGRLSEQQCMTVLKDAADVVRGLVALDRRYEGIPGWEKLHNQGRLGRAAEACAAHAGYDEPDYTVDRLGWQPEPRLLDGPPMPGLAGVMQAQYNLLLHLHEFPDAHSLRLVMDSQRIVAHEAADRITDVEPNLAAKWTTRKETYIKLVHETRDLGGLLGKGNAAGDGSIAASRAQKLDREPLIDTKQWHQLDRLFARIDERVCAAVEHGVKERLYFLRVSVPGLDERDGQLLRVTRRKYIPITSPVQTNLVPIVRQELRPEPARLHPPPGAAQSRLDFEAAINHRPSPRGALPDVTSI
ncbi:hypothetical protein [Nocardioides sp.]|uniref:hypothetical protein n=1 Tax=Nocardioides sp. TaxID=35761 RepID=UPI003D0CE608